MYLSEQMVFYLLLGAKYGSSTLVQLIYTQNNSILMLDRTHMDVLYTVEYLAIASISTQYILVTKQFSKTFQSKRSLSKKHCARAVS